MAIYISNMLLRAVLFILRPLIRMATDVDESFVRQYEAEVHLAYQRMGSLLRGTVRTKNGIVGESTTFQVIGKGEATDKPRHGDVQPMNVAHRPARCTLQDKYAPEYVDELDMLKVNHDERSAMVTTGVQALGRVTDQFIINAAVTTDHEVAVNFGGAASGMTLDKMLEGYALLGERDVPVGMGNTFCVVGVRQWTDLLKIPQFANSEWVGTDSLPFSGTGMTAKNWAGLMVFPHTGLPKSGRNRTCLMYHRDSIGHAIGQDVTSRIDWVAEKVAWLVNNSLSQGACLIDGAGVQKVLAQEPA